VSKLYLLRSRGLRGPAGMAGDYYLGATRYLMGDPGIWDQLRGYGREIVRSLAGPLGGLIFPQKKTEAERNAEIEREYTGTRWEDFPVFQGQQTQGGMLEEMIRRLGLSSSLAVALRRYGPAAIKIAQYLLRSPTLLGLVLAGTYTIEQVAEMLGVRGGAGFVGARPRRRRSRRRRSKRKSSTRRRARRTRRGSFRPRRSRRRRSRRRSRSGRRRHKHRIVSFRGDPPCDYEEDYDDGENDG